jgi:hypothetical protein
MKNRNATRERLKKQSTNHKDIGKEFPSDRKPFPFSFSIYYPLSTYMLLSKLFIMFQNL